MTDISKNAELQQSCITAVTSSAVDFFEPYELEFIDFLLNKDFKENNKDFSYGKIKKVEIIMNKIKALRLR